MLTFFMCVRVCEKNEFLCVFVCMCVIVSLLHAYECVFVFKRELVHVCMLFRVLYVLGKTQMLMCIHVYVYLQKNIIIYYMLLLNNLY